MIPVTALRITWDDGETDLVHADQRDGQAFDLWANRRGIIPPDGRDLFTVMPTVFLRVAAWSARNRRDSITDPWESFDARAVSVSMEGDPAAPDPTGEGSEG